MDIKLAKKIRSLVREVQNQVGINVGKYDISKCEFVKKGSIEVTKRVLLENVRALDEYARLSADTRRAFESLSKAQLIELLGKVDFEAILLKGCLLADYVKETADKIVFSVLFEFVAEDSPNELLAIANTDKKRVLSGDLIKDLEQFDLSVDFYDCLHKSVNELQESFLDEYGYNGIIDYSTPDDFSESKVKEWIKSVLWSYGGLNREFLFNDCFDLRFDSGVLSEFVDKDIPRCMFDTVLNIYEYYYEEWYERANKANRVEFLQNLKDSKQLSFSLFEPFEYVGLGDIDLYNAILYSKLSYEVKDLSGDLDDDLDRLDLEEKYCAALDKVVNKVYESIVYFKEESPCSSSRTVTDPIAREIKDFLYERAECDDASEDLLNLIDDLSHDEIKRFLWIAYFTPTRDYMYEFFNEYMCECYSGSTPRSKKEHMESLDRNGMLWEDFPFLTMLYDYDGQYDLYESFLSYASSEHGIEG